MKIAVAGDHRGFAPKEKVSMLLREQGHDVVDLGTNSARSCDYTDIAYVAAKAVTDGHVDRAILLCGSGIGMSIAANKVSGVRAALCNDELTAQMARQHNDANVLCLAADLLGEELMRRIIEAWLDTDFEGGRHTRRVRKIAIIEQGGDPTAYTDEDEGTRSTGLNI